MGMKRWQSSNSDELLKTTRDLIKAFLRANPSWLKGKLPDAALELHDQFLKGLQAQVTPSGATDLSKLVMVVNAQEPEDAVGGGPAAEAAESSAITAVHG
jgi:hypothetical protein